MGSQPPTLYELAGNRKEAPLQVMIAPSKRSEGASKKEKRNPALSARIDDNFSSCRTPLQVKYYTRVFVLDLGKQVYQDVLTDKESCEAMTESLMDRSVIHILDVLLQQGSPLSI